MTRFEDKLMKSKAPTMLQDFSRDNGNNNDDDDDDNNNNNNNNNNNYMHREIRAFSQHV